MMHVEWIAPSEQTAKFHCSSHNCAISVINVEVWIFQSLIQHCRHPRNIAKSKIKQPCENRTLKTQTINKTYLGSMWPRRIICSPRGDKSSGRGKSEGKFVGTVKKSSKPSMYAEQESKWKR
jgi:hypothetical protein